MWYGLTGSRGSRQPSPWGRVEAEGGEATVKKKGYEPDRRAWREMVTRRKRERGDGDEVEDEEREDHTMSSHTPPHIIIISLSSPLRSHRIVFTAYHHRRRP